MILLILRAHLVETGAPVEITVTGSHIESVRPADGALDGDLLVAPGFIDLQVNGYGGVNFNDPSATVADVGTVIRRFWALGVTTLCPTIVTESFEHMDGCIRTITAACEQDAAVAAAVACIHLEGPYIAAADGPRGAHPQEHVRPPDWHEFRRWQESAGGRIGIITLAPEHGGTAEFVKKAVAAGVLVAIGHTAADSAAIRQAVDAGARLSTHLGNGAHALIQRHPNYIWDQLAEDRLTASFIFDGHHLPPAVMKVMLRAKGLDHSVLVSDTTSLGGLPPGIYSGAVGRTVELLPTGRLTLHGTPYLAGSAGHLLDGVNNAMTMAGLPAAEAIRLATANPARALGLEHKLGAISPGATANLVLLEREPETGCLTVQATMVGGKWVYDRKGKWLA